MLETRRSFLKGAALALPLALWRVNAAAAHPASISVRDRGAKGDGRTLDTRPIQAAIDDAAASGKTVRFPPGKYVSGTLHLRHHTALHLEGGAVLIASRDDAHFDSPEVFGSDMLADRETSDFAFALLRGRGVSDVRIGGRGRLDGNRSSRSGPKPIALKLCRGVDIRDVTIANAGSYAVSLIGCEQVNVQDVTIRNGYADGIDPDCCRNVRIAGCDVDTRDDAICLKASLGLGVRRATENVRVLGCRLSTLHNAIKLGTESSGDFRKIAISDCTVVGRVHPWKGPLTSGIALETVDGGALEHVSIWNVRMAGVRCPIFIRRARRGRGQRVRIPGPLRDVEICDVDATGALLASSITGTPGYPVERIALRRIRLRAQGGGRAELASLSVPEMESRYPDATMYGDLPAYGLYFRHVVGLAAEDVDLTVAALDARPALVLDDLVDVRVRALRAMAPPDNQPLLWLHDVRGGRLRDIRPFGGGATVTRVTGATTAHTLLPRPGTGDVVTIESDVRSTAMRVEDSPLSP